MRQLFTPILRDSQTHSQPHPHTHTNTSTLQFAIVLWQPLLKSVSFSPALRLSFISCCFSASLSSSSASASSLKVAWPGPVSVSVCLSLRLSECASSPPFVHFSSVRLAGFAFAFFLFGVAFALKWFWHLSYFPCVDFCVSSTHSAPSPAHAPSSSSSAIGCWSCSPLQ